MAGTVSLGTPISISASASLSFICLTGFVQRRSVPDIFQRGTHLLVNTSGQVIAVLHSNTINLFGLEGRFLTVCGINEGQIEGVPSILVTQVFAANIPSVTPPVQNNLIALLLLLLQTNPTLFLQLLNSGQLGNLGALGLTGLTGLTALTSGTANVSALASAQSTLNALGLGTGTALTNVTGI